MPIKKDDAGRRFIEVEVQVPGTPDEVWRAIATGPGIASWFVPTTFEMGDDGKPVRVIANFGPGMESISTVTEWDPPQRMCADSADLGPDAPNVATEWIVEARDGGTCVVRVVHSLFASTDDWDNQLEGWENGWPDFFRILKLYLSHFSGQECAPLQLQAMTPLPRDEAWSRLSEALGCAGAVVGEQRSSADGAPRFRALVERGNEAKYKEELLLRLDAPAPGLSHMFAMPMGEKTLVSIRILFYGGEAGTVASAQEPVWTRWLASLFPSEEGATEAAGSA